MNDDLAIRLNRSIQNFLHLQGYRDADEFGLRMSRELARYIGEGLSVREAVAYALSSIKTSFFRANGLSKEQFTAWVETNVASAANTTRELDEQIRRFCAFAQRQLASELWKNRNDEGFLRGHLQTALASRGHRTLKEMTTGRGKADIALLDGESHEIIETKIWKGNEYFQDGLVELAEYLRTEGVPLGHYVVLDCSEANQLTSLNGTEWVETVGGKTIRVWFIQVSPEAPSKLRRSRRH